MVLASCHPHNCFRLWEFFSPIRRISRVAFFSRSSEGHYFRRSLDSELMPLRSSPYSSDASFKYSLISSWSLCSLVSKSPQVSSFVFQFFLVNCAFATFILNSYGGSFKNSLPLLPVVHWSPSQVYAISLSILSTRISSMSIHWLSSI